FYPVYARLFNIPFETVPLQADFTIPKEAFFQSQGGVIFPNPNAPTSIYLELGSIEEIAAQNPNQVVIIDEAYIDFASDSAVRLV
ncbi:aminotransferase class I/II-fold pyridoxal phosphate-dependent enzyme, partial [Planococcus sp. SIMBA_143]